MRLVRKCINICDSEVLDKLSKVKNQSAYITELIIKDIHSAEQQDINSIIINALKEYNVTCTQINNDNEIDLQAVLDIMNV